MRLAFAFLLSLVVTPIVAPTLPQVPPTMSALGGDVFREVLIGLAIGAVLRVFLTAMATAGEVISLSTTLSFAQTANPTEATQNTTLASFLSPDGGGAAHGDRPAPPLHRRDGALLHPVPLRPCDRRWTTSRSW